MADSFPDLDWDDSVIVVSGATFSVESCSDAIGAIFKTLDSDIVDAQERSFLISFGEDDLICEFTASGGLLFEILVIWELIQCGHEHISVSMVALQGEGDVLNAVVSINESEISNLLVFNDIVNGNTLSQFDIRGLIVVSNQGEVGRPLKESLWVLNLDDIKARDGLEPS